VLSLRFCLSLLAALGISISPEVSEAVSSSTARAAVTPAAEARVAMRAFSKALPDVQAYLRDTPAPAIAEQFITEAREEFSLARLYAYTGQWKRCAQAARVAASRLDDALIAARRAERQQKALEMALTDLTETLDRASSALRRTDFDPLASSTLAIAEQRRIEIAQLAADGRMRAAVWAAADARDLALLAIEQATDVTSAYALARQGDR
jgi:hypothetical protein